MSISTSAAKAAPPVGQVAAVGVDAVPSFVARLDAVRVELLAAQDDFTRIRIRDEARAAAAAAAVLRRRDIEVEASLLTADAEREVVKHNPKLSAKQGAYLRDNPDSAVALRRRGLMELVGSNEVLTRMRQAHAGFTDDEFEQIKTQHRAGCVPLTRAALSEHARARVKHTPRPGSGTRPAGGEASAAAPPSPDAAAPNGETVRPAARPRSDEPSRVEITADGKRRERMPGDMSLRVVMTEREYRQLEAFARKRGCSKSHVVRIAIRQHIATNGGNRPGYQPAAAGEPATPNKRPVRGPGRNPAPASGRNAKQ